MGCRGPGTRARAGAGPASERGCSSRPPPPPLRLDPGPPRRGSSSAVSGRKVALTELGGAGAGSLRGSPCGQLGEVQGQMSTPRRPAAPARALPAWTRAAQTLRGAGGAGPARLHGGGATAGSCGWAGAEGTGLRRPSQTLTGGQEPGSGGPAARRLLEGSLGVVSVSYRVRNCGRGAGRDSCQRRSFSGDSCVDTSTPCRQPARWRRTAFSPVTAVRPLLSQDAPGASQGRPPAWFVIWHHCFVCEVEGIFKGLKEIICTQTIYVLGSNKVC